MALFQTVNVNSFSGPTGATGPGIPISGSRNAQTERGGSITLGGTRQAVAAANTNRNGFAFQNLSTGDLWLRANSAAAAASQPSMLLIAGAYYEMPMSGIQTGAIDVFGATTGQAFAAWEW